MAKTLLLCAAALTGCVVDGLEGEGEGDIELGEVTSQLTACTSSAEGACDGTLEFVKNGRSYYLPYYRNYALSSSSSQITRAVIVIHGANREPWRDWGALMSALQAEDVHTSPDVMAQTIVLAPHFVECPAASADRLCWSTSFPADWPAGGLSDAGGADDFSSFEIVDEILERLVTGRFPNLERVTFVGHSAGGQFTQRYALLGQANQWTIDGIDYRYVVANPSSYAYLNSYRYRATGWSNTEPADCHPDSEFMNLFQEDDWDDWRYGLRQRTGSEYTYVAWGTASSLASLYKAKDVVYLIGELDTSTHQLDMTCPAMDQGLNRKNRAYRFKNHLDIFFPDHRHRLYEIADAGHSAWQVYPSSYGRAVLFR